MKCYIIAQILDSNSKALLGYRLFDADSQKGEIMDVALQNIKKVLEKDPTLIKNAKLIAGTINGTNGKLERYAKIDSNGNLISGEKSPLVVINKIENIGYTVVDFKGQQIKMSNEKAVEYAKTNGIANGKVVEQDNIEFISSITDSYEVIKLPTSKVGNTGKVNIPIRIGSDAASVAKNTANDIETEMAYNDVFSVMSNEQRSVLKQYYTWYTVDCYKKMAKNVRLNLAPGKAEKLAQLRGIDKWEFAGINDSYLSGNFKAHCELGHRLRYEYFAIPEGVLDKDYKVRSNRVRAGLSRTNGQKDAVQELRDAGAIVFGETCAGDFFHISPEDMKKLVKTRKTMSDEIELMSNIITNSLEQDYIKKVKLLYQVIQKLGNPENMRAAFGDNVAFTLLAFMKTNMPFPMSLVILASEKIREDMESFWTKVFPEYSSLITRMLKARESTENSPYALSAGGNLIWYISNFAIEGKYQYDPLTDNDGIRKDIGRYNKETREERTAIVNSLILGTSVNVTYLNNIETIESYLKVINYLTEMSKIIEVKFKEKQLNSKYTITNYYKTLESSLSTYSSNVEKHDKLKQLTDENKKMLSLFASAFSSIKEYATGFKIYEKYYTNRYTHSRRPSFRVLYVADYMTRLNAWKNISEISLAIDEMKLSKDSIVDTVLNYEADKIKDELEAERKKDRYYIFKINISDKTSKFDEDRLIAAKLDYITNSEFLRAMEKGTYYGVNANEVDEESKLLETDVIASYEEVNKSTYESYIETIEYNRKRARRIKAQQEEADRLEKERIEKLAEEQRKREEEQSRLEQENEAKLDKLRELINKYIGSNDYYGIRTAKAILDSGIRYDKMMPKQRWRINKTLEELTELENNNGTNIDYDLDSVISKESDSSNNSADSSIKDQSDVKTDTIADESSTIEKDKVSIEIKETTKTEEKEPEKTTEEVETKKSKTSVNEENIKGLNDAEAEKAIRCLLGNVNIKEEKDSNIAFATKVALTVSRYGSLSEKQKNFLMKGYNQYLEKYGESGC